MMSEAVITIFIKAPMSFGKALTWLTTVVEPLPALSQYSMQFPMKGMSVLSLVPWHFVVSPSAKTTGKRKERMMRKERTFFMIARKKNKAEYSIILRLVFFCKFFDNFLHF